MKLSTRGRYGLRMLVDLCCQQKEVVTLSSIAKRQNVSVNYLEQLSKDLKRAGYISSTKGPKGGYSLLKEPGDIIIGDVLRLLEGDLLIAETNAKEDTILKKCVKEAVYDPLNHALSEFFDSMTLQDVIKKE